MCLSRVEHTLYCPLNEIDMHNSILLGVLSRNTRLHFIKKNNTYLQENESKPTYLFSLPVDLSNSSVLLHLCLYLQIGQQQTSRRFLRVDIN